ncbi:hypothetical protein [Cohnella faecalis]|nr:hypothetical protein [Cohnella faecalis]
MSAMVVSGVKSWDSLAIKSVGAPLLDLLSPTILKLLNHPIE